ncbi:MAG: ABC transporter ATP-binding protein [Atopococcus tabaci]|uniref:ABC transporter ATP-binding protein n=1 Tax=Atopococcus tabaci TaxID=269774 RepID=A0AA43UDD0_9LACT|nr:ABC transporter ATP-binding protein [Atopococcus tabaci]
MNEEKINEEEMDKKVRDKPKQFSGTIKRLIRYMSNYAWLFLLVLILASLSAILNAQLPRIMGNITTLIFNGLQTGLQDETGRYLLDFQGIGQTIGVLAGVYALAAVFRYFQQFITARVSQRTVYNLRKDLKEKMGRLPISYFDTHSTGDILSRAINDMDQVANSLGQSLTQLTTSVVQFIAIIVTMLTLSGPLAIIVILMIPLNFLLIGFVAPKAQKQFAERQKNIGELNDYVEEVYTGHSVVKIYNQEEYEKEQFDQLSDDVNTSSWRAEFYAGMMNPLVGFAKDMAYVAVAIVGGFGVLNGSIQIGIVQSFLQYVNQFSQPFRSLANLANTIQITVAATERVFEILDEEEMQEEKGKDFKENTDYEVEFEHVQFGYKEDELLMKDFNLQVRAGEMIAIVGPTGAGKTTLINLLERFYDIDGGVIRYRGEDIRNIDREDLRDDFAMVLQDTWLFEGTIWDNLKYGAGDVSDEQILEAAKAANVHDFVASLPEGYQTVLTELGSNISQGQRQLITIARAFLRNPEVLILDEATSSVDTRTEMLIQRAMNKLLEGRTSFVVAHRLSTIRDADKIVVMVDGDSMEQGNHEELLAEDGIYADLYHAQFA